MGATSEVGVELAKLFGANYYDLILINRDINRLDHLKSSLELTNSIDVQLVELDIQSTEEYLKFIEDVGHKVSVVVCLIGYLGDQQLAQNSVSETDKIIDINFRSIIPVLNAIANIFEKNKTGTIIGISSVAGERGRQSNYIYGSAKAAFTTYLSGLRNRLNKFGVHVITVKPGFMRTKMIEDIGTPALLTILPQKAASKIYKAYRKKSNVVYVAGIWRYIMLIIRNIPEPIFKKLNL